MNQTNRLASYGLKCQPENTLPDTKEFERLLGQCESDIQAFVFTLLPNWSDVDDVLQRVRVILWRKFSNFEPGTSFRAWALQVARYEVSNFRRNQQRDLLCFDDALVESLAEVQLSLTQVLEQRRAVLEECLKKLRASDRQIIRHCYGPSATTTKEAAAKLNRPVNTLYKALNRIRRLLTECVQQNGQEEPRNLK